MQNLRDNPYKKEIKPRFFPLSVSFIWNALGRGLVTNSKSKMTYSVTTIIWKKTQTQHLWLFIMSEIGVRWGLHQSPGSCTWRCTICYQASYCLHAVGVIKELSLANSRVGRSKGTYIYLKDTDQIITGLGRKGRREEASSPAHSLSARNTSLLPYSHPWIPETWCQEQAPLPLRCWEYQSSQGHREVGGDQEKSLPNVWDKNSISKKMTFAGTRGRDPVLESLPWSAQIYNSLDTLLTSV